jgi:hypothetical protein
LKEWWPGAELSAGFAKLADWNFGIAILLTPQPSRFDVTFVYVLLYPAIG